MAYFPNGASGDAYMERWCFRCVNWRDEEESLGCAVMDLHLISNYDQCGEDDVSELYKEVLEHFIPTKDNGFPDKCTMFIEKSGADITGQMTF